MAEQRPNVQLSFEGPGMSRKKRGLTKELILGDTGLKKIPEGLDQYGDLEVLYLDHNKIRKLKGLMANFRLRFLDLAKNSLTTLVGSDITSLGNLETLILRGNEIGDIKTQAKELAILPCLRRLEIQDNPMANESDARLYLIAMLPRLETLDCHGITPAERITASKMAKEKGWLKAEEVVKLDPNAPQRPPQKKKVKKDEVFYKMYPRGTRKRLTQADLDRPTACELDAQHNALRVIRKKNLAAHRARAKLSIIPKHVPLSDSELERDYREIGSDLPQTQQFKAVMSQTLNRVSSDKATSTKKRSLPGDVLTLTRWSEVNNTRLLGHAPPRIASRQGAHTSLGLSTMPSRATSRASVRPALGTHSVSVSFGGLPKIPTTSDMEVSIRPFTPMFATFNQRCVLDKINTRANVENRVLPKDPYVL